MAANSKTAVVFLGAGASYDAANGTSQPNALWRPPLARQLFSSKQHLLELLAEHPGAQAIQSTQRDLVDVAPGAELNLEARLSEIANDPVLGRAFVEVPLYLRDYLARCSHQFIGRRPETYGELVTKLLQTGHSVAFVSLNYDTLLEQAISSITTNRTFRRLSDYVLEEPLVIKPHGSVDWEWLYPRREGESDETFLKNLADSAVTGNRYETKLTVSRPEIGARPKPIHFRDSSGHMEYVDGAAEDAELAWAYPALTAPLANKGAGNIVARQDHLDKLARFQRDCTKYLFIGTSGLDRHVLEMLGAGCVDTVALTVVDSGSVEQLNEIQIRIADGLRAGGARRVRKMQTKQAADGFGNWVASGGLDEFLAY